MFSGGIEVEHWLKMGYCTVSNFTNTLALLYPFIIRFIYQDAFPEPEAVFPYFSQL